MVVIDGDRYIYHMYEDSVFYTIIGREFMIIFDKMMAKCGTEAIAESWYRSMEAQDMDGGQYQSKASPGNFPITVVKGTRMVHSAVHIEEGSSSTRTTSCYGEKCYISNGNVVFKPTCQGWQKRNIGKSQSNSNTKSDKTLDQSTHTAGKVSRGRNRPVTLTGNDTRYSSETYVAVVYNNDRSWYVGKI